MLGFFFKKITFIIYFSYFFQNCSCGESVINTLTRLMYNVPKWSATL